MRFFLEIAFRGTQYNGWQVQPNGVSIQEKIDGALSTILRENIHCIGCGRTDTGVHARQFFLHFDAISAFPPDFLHRMNAFLPPDIAVMRCIPLPDDAHARFDATERAYRYYLLDAKDPFAVGFAFYKPFYHLDFAPMREACNILKKYSDFYCFCKSKAGSKTTVVDIRECYWIESEGLRTLHISADRFLRGMVRLIVGAMLRIGEGKMTLEIFEQGIADKKRFRYAFSAPPEGLFLVAVKYPYIEDVKRYAG